MNKQTVGEFVLLLCFEAIFFGTGMFLGHAAQAPDDLACFGDRTMDAAQQAAVVWVHNHPDYVPWNEAGPNLHVRCVPQSNRHWAECSVGAMDAEQTAFVLDCDTATRNNVGCR